jgi:ubiquinol-cytochrome c reductase cytochrome c subunit
VRGELRRRARLALALLCGAGALCLWAAPSPPARAQSASPPAPAPGSPAAQGRTLFVSGCSSCHGFTARGVPGKGPSLIGVGAQAADFYLSTGRMPLAIPRVEPVRNPPIYTPRERREIVAYVGGLGGPPIPKVDPAAGNLKRGFADFADNCAGCHAVTAKGGVVPNGVAPSLQQATATQIAEAVRVGPYLMPRFPNTQIGPNELNDLTRYVLSTHHLDNRGGWGIGNIGPVPEGLVAWGLAMVSLLLICRALGERT